MYVQNMEVTVQLIDTHCHLDFPQYKEDLDDVVKRAVSSGVIRMIVPGTDAGSSREAVELAQRYQDVFAAVGIHPHGADKSRASDMADLRNMAVTRDKVVAVGEIGLDHYKGYSSPENQQRLFRSCLSLASELDLPVIMHNRDADEDFLGILKEQGPFKVKGVVHCFSGGRELLKEILALGLYVSFAGNITFDKAGDLKMLAEKVPPERLLLETDSPFLSPKPFRGQRNEPAYVGRVLDLYAEMHGLSPADMARITTHNANQLFKLGVEKRNTIAYPIRDSLYLNITYRCTNRCSFCIRDATDYVKGHDLKLDKEPTVGQVIEAMGDVTKYKEIVFCGYGEPTLRLNVVTEVAKYVKSRGGRLRLITNGEGNLISGRNIVPDLDNYFDRISVSLNAPSAAEYDRLCRSVFGEKAFEGILDFIRECRKGDINIEVTCLDAAGEKVVTKCHQITDVLGAEFRLRRLDVVG
ncbi:MAG: TatD family hydrolase [Candidatus Omnitrophota bacterium]